MACHPRATYHLAGCCHLVNSLSRFQSHMPHCRVQTRAGARRGLGGTQHPNWEFPAPVLRQAHSPTSTPTQHPLWAYWAMTMSSPTVLWQIYSDMEVVHDCNCNSAVVETPTTWRLLNLVTSDITASDWLQKIHDTTAFALTLPSCQMKNNYYERFWLASFGPSYYARRVYMHSADYAVARCPSVRPLHRRIVSKRLNISSHFVRSSPAW